MLKKISTLIVGGFFIIGLSSYNQITPAPQQKSQLKTLIIDAGHGLPNSNAQGKYS